MTSDSSNRRAWTRSVRERMAATGENYTTASRQLTSTAVLDATPDYGPWPYESNLDRPLTIPDELGVRALPPGSTPAQRARAEAVWRPVNAEYPCRCTGSCLHAQRCNNGDDGIGSCTGQLIHADRHPGSMFSLITWEDVYSCDTCSEVYESSASLPEVPWGENTAAPAGSASGSITTVYDGVRHPNLSPVLDDDEVEPIYAYGECECGFYPEEDDEGRIDSGAHCCECGASGVGWEYNPCGCPGQQ